MKSILISIYHSYQKMSKIQCYGCLNPCLEEFKGLTLNQADNEGEQPANKSMRKNSQGQKSAKVTFKLQQSNQPEEQNSIFFTCQCCNNSYCLKCCRIHRKKVEALSEKNPLAENAEKNHQEDLASKNMIKVICQECEDCPSVKYCQNCQQFLCEKCSFKIHNKGKRAKHQLQENIGSLMHKKFIILLNKDILTHLKQLYKGQKKIQSSLCEFIKYELRTNIEECLVVLQESLQKQFDSCDLGLKFSNFQELKYEGLLLYTHQYPFVERCKIVVTNKQASFHKKIFENYQNRPSRLLQIELVNEYKKKVIITNHERVNSQKIQLKHTKNFSNFSNLSAISKVQNQSVLSNEQSDLFQSNQLSLNITLNQNSSILMMGAFSDRQKEQKQQRKLQTKEKENDKLSMGAHRIYSIRQQNSHNSANNLSTSTENSIRKRNKKWPIPYFQPFRIPKYLGGAKYNAQLYLRQLAEKGILMIRREKAQEFLLDPELTRSFVRNIGEKQIEYISYIIDFLSVECLTWVIESIKEDKMTPNQKLIQSRLKESFELKINMKLWDSIIKYLQSSQYDQDYFQNTKSRYVPKISIVKYGQQYLLQFQERKWAYEDQQLLDEEQEQWKQFKKLITDYFNEKSQITGGRYGCVQYVKLNGPKPLRKCSLGKISLYVQEAINKGIIRYHKTLLVSNSENNNSMCSNANGIITNSQQLAQFQKDIKIMALQIGLIDLFLQSPPNTPISMAQIPLNLKNKVLFDYNLVELGFPKLKNLMITLNDKLILQSTKTHTSYQTTTNGSQATQKLRNKLAESSQKYLAHILTYINLIISHFQSITLEDLYNQLTLKLGFPFDFKIYNVPDFYQFSLYYCPQIINIQFISGIFVAFSNYPNLAYQNTQAHRTTYSQDQYPTYGGSYQHQPAEYSRTTQKKGPHEQEKYPSIKVPSLSSEAYDQIKYASSETPKFNSSYGKKKFDTLWQECYEDNLKKEDKIQEDYFLQQKMMQQNINNILDDSASHPKTVIVNDSSFNNPNQLYLSKNQQPMDEHDSFYGVWGESSEMKKEGKMQHIRVKSTTQPAVKHFRGYSTTQARK